MAMAAVDDSSL